MIQRETWELAISALLANKVKAALTMLGITVGSACIVLVVTISLIGKNYVVGRIEDIGSNLIYAYYPGNEVNRSIADQISLADLNAARELAHVVKVAGTRDVGNARVVIDAKERPIALIGVTEDFQKIRNLLILKGRFFDDIDMQTHAKACLMSQELARQFKQNMIGNVIRVGDLSFAVIGIFRERVGTFGESEIATQSILIPFSLMKLYKGDEYVRTLYVRAESLQDVPIVTDEVRRMLESRHRRGVGYNVQNLAALIDAARNIATTLTAVLMMVSGIALVISGVGIMNIMLVTVSERTPEIGLRKAVGARRRDILYQFLIEAFVISGIGSLLGILIAISAKFVAQPLLPLNSNVHIPISVLSIMIAFLASCGTGILFGYLPADKASRLQPTESLHYE